MKLVVLNRERERRERQRRHAAKARLVHHARQCDDEIDGFAIVTFRHLPDDTGSLCQSDTRYWVRDTIDAHRLPELARSQIERVIARNVDPAPKKDA